MKCVTVTQHAQFDPFPPGAGGSGPLCVEDCVVGASHVPMSAWFRYSPGDRAVQYFSNDRPGPNESVVVIPSNAALSDYEVDVGNGWTSAVHNQQVFYETTPGNSPGSRSCFWTPRGKFITIRYKPTGQTIQVEMGSVFLGSGCECP